MADTKISALATQTGVNVDPTADILVTVDVSDTSMGSGGTDKKITINDLSGSQMGVDLLLAAGWALP